jgi:hypothetical protein
MRTGRGQKRVRVEVELDACRGNEAGHLPARFLSSSGTDEAGHLPMVTTNISDVRCIRARWSAKFTSRLYGPADSAVARSFLRCIDPRFSFISFPDRQSMHPQFRSIRLFKKHALITFRFSFA